MPIDDYLDCFWEIITALRYDRELAILAEEMWLILLFAETYEEHQETFGKPPDPAAVTTADDDQQRKHIHKLSREEFNVNCGCHQLWIIQLPYYILDDTGYLHGRSSRGLQA